MDASIDGLRELVTRHAPGAPLGLYLTGSSCVGGLRPDSDLDVLLVTRRSLRRDERRLLVTYLMGHSGRRATIRVGRPVELTSLVLDDITPWRYPATRDLLYGEWLRPEYEAGILPDREVDPNLPVILTSAREHSRVLVGAPLAELTDPVPRHDLARSMVDVVPTLLDDLVGDERNVLLTLARVLVTLRDGVIVPKDVAAADVAPTLAAPHGAVLDLAARAYRGEVVDDWTDIRHDAHGAAAALRDRIGALPP